MATIIYSTDIDTDDVIEKITTKELVHKEEG